MEPHNPHSYTHCKQIHNISDIRKRSASTLRFPDVRIFLFTDHASPIRRKMLTGKLMNISRGNVRTRYRVKTDKK